MQTPRECFKTPAERLWELSAWDKPSNSLANGEIGKPTKKRSRDKSGLWEGKRHLTIKAFLQTVRRLSHSNVNTQSQQPSKRVGILIPQSVVQNEVSIQSTARRVWDRAETDKKSVCVFVYADKSGEFLLVTRGWGKTAWLQFPAKTGKQLLEGGGKRENDREGGRRGGLSVEHAQSLSQAVQNHPLSQMHRLCASQRRWRKCGHTHTHTSTFAALTARFNFALLN